MALGGEVKGEEESGCRKGTMSELGAAICRLGGGEPEAAGMGRKAASAGVAACMASGDAAWRRGAAGEEIDGADMWDPCIKFTSFYLL